MKTPISLRDFYYNHLDVDTAVELLDEFTTGSKVQPMLTFQRLYKKSTGRGVTHMQLVTFFKSQIEEFGIKMKTSKL